METNMQSGTFVAGNSKTNNEVSEVVKTAIHFQLSLKKINYIRIYRRLLARTRQYLFTVREGKNCY